MDSLGEWIHDPESKRNRKKASVASAKRMYAKGYDVVTISVMLEEPVKKIEKWVKDAHVH